MSQKIKMLNRVVWLCGVLLFLPLFSGCGPADLSAMFPERIEGLERVLFKTGEDGIEEARKAYGSKYQITEGVHAAYGQAFPVPSQVKVARTVSADEARAALERLLGTLEGGDALVPEHRAGVDLYRLEAGGDELLFWAREDQNWFIRAAKDEVEPLLKVFLDGGE